ncbi:dihydroneopterin aldolase [Azomonas agilis]|uniref:7,8-dihydroneopterin aldolase n=1 Tax=Azomonas agilis TaxID=116849 RepID=A0A562I1A4_9GAMM|nr:dihydroneopterin aldolase [Azomonas agilis]TWH64445.1 dihydroneopterin aldolase [Azomonas agilis]
MDTVFIKGLEIETLIGAYTWERSLRQCLHLDLDMAWDIHKAAQSDDLEHALDYAQVVAHIQAFAHQAQYQLVESFADHLAVHLMQDFGIRWMRLRVTKPGVNIHARQLGIEIERGQR